MRNSYIITEINLFLHQIYRDTLYCVVRMNLYNIQRPRITHVIHVTYARRGLKTSRMSKNKFRTYKVKYQQFFFLLLRVDLGIGELLVTLSLFIVSHGSLKQLSSQAGSLQP